MKLTDIKYNPKNPRIIKGEKFAKQVGKSFNRMHMKITKIKLSKLNLNSGQVEGLPKNPRFIRDEKYEKLLNSLREDPEMIELREIVAYDNNGELVVIMGNMRLRALKELGEIETTVKVLPSETPVSKLKAYTIKDNVSYGEHDWDALANEWDADQLDDWGLDLPVFDVKKEEVGEDDYSEPEEVETDIQYGDLFKIGNHYLLCGDATKKEDCEKLMQGKKADMIFTDPPYDLEDSYSQNIFDAAKDDCHVFIMNSDKLLIENVNNGFEWFRKFFAVDFRQARLVSNNQPMTRVDLIAEFCKGKTKFNNLHDGFSTLIECAKIHNDNETINFGHKQAKKTELPANFIQHYSNKKELIFDFFGGSGSTMAACEQLERDCYMMEFEPKNCQIIIDRMEKCYNLVANKLN